MDTKTNHYYKMLPTNYVSDYIIDGSVKKTRNLLMISFLVLWAITFVIAEAINRFNFAFEFEIVRTILTPIVFIVTYILMIILHELIHGLFNKIFTHEKLTFGFNKGSAYCGIPDIYIKKWPKVIIAIAPFITFLTVLITVLIFVKDPYYYMVISIFLGLHVGGCSGDLYEIAILVFKYYGKKVLVNDTGPKQEIFVGK